MWHNSCLSADTSITMTADQLGTGRVPSKEPTLFPPLCGGACASFFVSSRGHGLCWPHGNEMGNKCLWLNN